MKTPAHDTPETSRTAGYARSIETVPASLRTPPSGGDIVFPPSIDPATLDTQQYIRECGRSVAPRPASPLDLHDGVPIDDAGLFRADLARLRRAWPWDSAPHLFRDDCSVLWALPKRRTNEVLFRMRPRGWIEMWSCLGFFTYHLLPAGAALCAEAVADG